MHQQHWTPERKVSLNKMRVSGFMVPAEKVVTATPKDTTVREIMDLMLKHKVGAIVIITMESKEMTTAGLQFPTIPIAMGIITKSDILQAYHNRVDIDAPCQKIMGDHKLVSCHPEDDRDTVARILEKNKTHHVIVVDDERHAHFVGIVSSWDIAAECAKDGGAWPYLRGEDGKISFPVEKVAKDDEDLSIRPPYDPKKPTSIVNHKHDQFTTYMDDLDMEAFQ